MRKQIQSLQTPRSTKFSKLIQRSPIVKSVGTYTNRPQLQTETLSKCMCERYIERDIHFHRSAYTCSQLHREEHQRNDQQKQLQPPIQHRFFHHSHCPSPPKFSPNNPKKFKKPIIRKNKAKKDETLCTMNMYLFLQEYAITLRIYIRALFKAQSRVEESVQEFNFVNLKRTLRKKERNLIPISDGTREYVYQTRKRTE